MPDFHSGPLSLRVKTPIIGALPYPYEVAEDFQTLIPALTSEEYQQLETSLLTEGCRDPLLFWWEQHSVLWCKYCEDGAGREVAVSFDDGRWICHECGYGLAPEIYQLLDGHNRLAICTEHAIPYRLQILNDTLDLPTREAATVWILRNQLGRRNLSDIDRVAVALKLKPLLVEQAKERQLGGLKQFHEESVVQNSAQREAPRTRDEVARLAGVSHDTVTKATTILDHGTPTLVQAVRENHASISAAAEVATLPAPEQEEIVARGEKEILEVAKRIRAEKAHRTKFTGENEWYTPVEYITLAKQVLDAIDLDPASSELAQETIQAGRYYGLDDDALQQPWYGKVWLNPPYSQPLIAQFIEKLLGELQDGHTTEAILLTHNYTDTAWFQQAAQQAQVLCFPKGRIRFISALGDIAAPTQGQTFFYFGPNALRFQVIFQSLGFLVEVIHGTT